MTQEEYIVFILIGILSALSVAACIFWARSSKFKRLNTTTIKVTLEEIVQEFNQKINKISWNEITKIVFKKKGNSEILYIDVCERKNYRIRLYGLESWGELIHKIEFICKDKNIEIEESNARIGSRGYLLGDINFISILMTPAVVLISQLRISKLYTYADILLFVFGVLVSIDMAFLTEPLETDRSKYKYFTIFFVLLWISIYFSFH